LSASLGIAVFPEDGDEAAILISRADNAMYRSKKRGRGSFEFHSPRTSSDRGLELTPSGASRSPTHDDLATEKRIPRLRDLREANEQLVIAAMTAHELEAQVEEVHNRQIKYLAMVAHELRNPLTPIRTAAELLKRGASDQPLMLRLQGVIERQVAHMSRLVEDLLDGSRVSTGKFRLEMATVEMAEILGLVVHTCRPAMDARRQHLKVDVPTSPLLLRGDPVRLAQIFSNLLDNASKYTPEGGQIALTVCEQDSALVVTVSDDGIGITEEALHHVFEMFVQGTRALTAQNRGLGIGLAVVRELVEGHGGTVVAKSDGKDRGSEFIVTLPRSA